MDTATICLLSTLAAIAAASCRVACCELASRRLAVLHHSSSAGLLAVAHPFAALPAGEVTWSRIGGAGLLAAAGWWRRPCPSNFITLVMY